MIVPPVIKLFLHPRRYWMVWLVTFEINCIYIYVRLDVSSFYFSHAYVFIILYHVVSKVLVKSHDRFRVLK